MATPLDALTITTPSSGSMASVVRAVVMSAAVSSELTVDRVEDAALAANEAFRTVAASVGPDGSVVCRLQPGAGSIEVSIGAGGNLQAQPIDLDRLGEVILSGVTDRYQTVGGSGISFSLSNRA